MYNFVANTSYVEEHLLLIENKSIIKNLNFKSNEKTIIFCVGPHWLNVNGGGYKCLCRFSILYKYSYLS